MSDTALPARESMEFDVVIVGAGPAGLAAAIRLKQVSPETSVVVVEKGSEVGAHILSGAVIDPSALDRLLPEWRRTPTARSRPKSRDDRFMWLTETGAIRVPLFFAPPLMSNHGCFIGSLGLTCKCLASKAEALGVEIYPGFAAAEIALRSERRGARHRHRRHGHRQERRAQSELHARHGIAREIHVVRRRRARQPDARSCSRNSISRKRATRRNSASA